MVFDITVSRYDVGKQQLVDEYAREHLCATCEWKNDNICTLPRCMKMEERSKNERKTAQPR